MLPQRHLDSASYMDTIIQVGKTLGLKGKLAGHDRIDIRQLFRLASRLTCLSFLD